MAVFCELGANRYDSTKITELYVGEAPAIAAMVNKYVIQFDIYEGG